MQHSRALARIRAEWIETTLASEGECTATLNLLLVDRVDQSRIISADKRLLLDNKHREREMCAEAAAVEMALSERIEWPRRTITM